MTTNRQQEHRAAVGKVRRRLVVAWQEAVDLPPRACEKLRDAIDDVIALLDDFDRALGTGPENSREEVSPYYDDCYKKILAWLEGKNAP